LNVNIPPTGTIQPPAASPIDTFLSGISSLFAPNPPIQGLPIAPPALSPPIFPAGSVGAAFTSNPTPVKTAEELAKLQLTAQVNQPTTEQVINKPTLGRPAEQADDPDKKE